MINILVFVDKSKYLVKVLCTLLLFGWLYFINYYSVSVPLFPKGELVNYPLKKFNLFRSSSDPQTDFMLLLFDLIWFFLYR